MHRRFCLTFVFLFLTVPALGQIPKPDRYQEGKSGKAELKYVNDLPVLIVEGTPEEIGKHTAALTKGQLRRLMNFAPDLLKAFGQEKRLPLLIHVGKGMVPQFPPDHLKEVEALVKESGIERDLVIVGNTFPDISKIGGCSTLIVEAERSTTGKPIFGRNLDYTTGGILQDYSMVLIVRPKGKHAFAAVGFPGMVGVISGMNDAGLAIATLEVRSSKDKSAKFDGKGVPYGMAYRRVLEECTTAEEAETLLRTIKHTTMNNLAICDKKGGAVLEITTENVVVRKPENGFCPCTNHFRSDKLATDTKCFRFEALDKCRDMGKLDRLAVAKLLHAANQGEHTLQTMIFEPASLKLHLAIGKCPTSALPMKTLDLTTYFEKASK